MLKSLGDRDIVEEYEETISPMGFLHKNLPFEFLISRFSFLQGLLHWIAGVALTLLSNGPDASISRRWPQPRPLIAAISARSSRTQKSPLTQ